MRVGCLSVFCLSGALRLRQAENWDKPAVAAHTPDTESATEYEKLRKSAMAVLCSEPARRLLPAYGMAGGKLRQAGLGRTPAEARLS